MLMHPFVDIPYDPKLLNFLSGIEIYGREETLGKELQKYNPNTPEDLDIIVRKYILPDLNFLSYRHKYRIFHYLNECLNDPCTNFKNVFVPTHDDFLYYMWDESEIKDPRGFFESIFKSAREFWEEDLHKASLEDQSTW